MRFFEFRNTDANIDKFIVSLKNHIGRAASKKSPAKLSWAAISSISHANGFEFSADPETFKMIYDSNTVIQSIVKDFDERGVELLVPGLPGEQEPVDTQNSADQIGKIADANAAKQLSQNQQGIKV